MHRQTAITLGFQHSTQDPYIWLIWGFIPRQARSLMYNVYLFLHGHNIVDTGDLIMIDIYVDRVRVGIQLHRTASMFIHVLLMFLLVGLEFGAKFTHHRAKTVSQVLVATKLPLRRACTMYQCSSNNSVLSLQTTLLSI